MQNARRERDLLAPAVLALIIWSTLAIGGVYPWAYWPLLAGCLIVGTVTAGSPWDWTPGEVSRTVAIAGVAVLLAIAVQLVPVPTALIAGLSPGRQEFLSQFDVSYAGGLSLRHAMSIDPSGTWRGWCFLAGLSVLLVGLVRVLDHDRTRQLAGGVVVFALIVAVMGIVSRGFQSTKVYGLWTPESSSALPFGPFVNRNHFAGWMVMALSVSLGYLSASASRAMRGLKPGWRNQILWWSSPQANRLIIVAVSCAIMGLALVLTSSRSGIGGFALSVLLTGWVVARRQMARARKMAVGAYLAVLVITVVGWVGLDSIAQRFAAANWSSLNDRLGAWRDALRVFRAFPLAGAGWNTYGTAMLLYQTSQVNQFHFAEAHNDYLQMLAEGGLLVGIPVLAGAWALGRHVRRRFADGVDDTGAFWLRAGATTALVAVLLQETVDFSLQIPANAVLFTVLLAIALHRGSPRPLRGPSLAPESSRRR